MLSGVQSRWLEFIGQDIGINRRVNRPGIESRYATPLKYSHFDRLVTSVATMDIRGQRAIKLSLCSLEGSSVTQAKKANLEGANRITSPAN